MVENNWMDLFKGTNLRRTNVSWNKTGKRTVVTHTNDCDFRTDRRSLFSRQPMDWQPVRDRLCTNPLRPPRPAGPSVYLHHHQVCYIYVRRPLCHVNRRQAGPTAHHYWRLLHAMHLPLPTRRHGHDQRAQRGPAQHHDSVHPDIYLLLPRICQCHGLPYSH